MVGINNRNEGQKCSCKCKQVKTADDVVYFCCCQTSFWLLGCGIAMLVCASIFPKQILKPFSQHPQYNSTAVQSLLTKEFFPQAIVFNYKDYNLDPSSFVPNMPNYKFYSCLEMSYIASKNTSSRGFYMEHSGFVGSYTVVSSDANMSAVSDGAVLNNCAQNGSITCTSQSVLNL